MHLRLRLSADFTPPANKGAQPCDGPALIMIYSLYHNMHTASRCAKIIEKRSLYIYIYTVGQRDNDADGDDVDCMEAVRAYV